MQPVVIALPDSAPPSISPVTLNALDGTGVIRVAGTMPSKQPGRLAIEVMGFDLHDLYDLLQRDTTGVSGDVGLDLQVSGTAEAPLLRGTATLGAAGSVSSARPWYRAW